MYSGLFDKIFAMLHPVLAPVANTENISNVVPIKSLVNPPAITITTSFLQGISQAISPANATQLADSINAHAYNYGITAAMLPMFLSQTMVESSFYNTLQENLFYTTPERIKAVWPTRFNTANDAVPYLRNPQRLANFVYGGRMGNTDPNDGYLYLGRGAIQLTGRANYEELELAWKRPYAQLCSYLIAPEGAIESAMYYWQRHNLGQYTTHDQVAECTAKINGGLNGLKDRLAVFDNIETLA